LGVGKEVSQTDPREIVYGTPRRLTGFDYSDADHAYFVTIRARHGTAPFTGAELSAAILTSLDWLRTSRGVRLYAYCLMTDHLHVLLRLDDAGSSLGTVIGAFKSFTTRQSWRLGSSGQLWQTRFYDHILRRSEEGDRVVRYILENPIRQGLVDRAEDYPYSGTPDTM
jgi:putative transposase